MNSKAIHSQTIRIFRGMNQPQVLRDLVKTHLLNQIKNGELQIGKTINLAALARQTGISVTPIREALSQLEHARIIKAVPNRGFIVQRLGSTEAEHLYETIAQLEVMAIENTVFSAQTMEDLRRAINTSSNTDSAAEQIKLRFEFHDLLIRDCNNSILVQILSDLKTRLLFYEQALYHDLPFYSQVHSQNQSILRAIEEDNIPTAALILKMHWMNALEHIQNRLKAAKNI